LGRERDSSGGARKWHGSFEKMALVDLTIGLNQHLGIFGDVNQYKINLMKIVNQYLQTFLNKSGSATFS
jgi:hypothetical protein